MPDLETVGWYDDAPSAHPVVVADGVESHHHPVAMLLYDEPVAMMVDRFQSYGPDLPAHEYERALSAWEVEAWLTMRGAHFREQQRRIKGDD